MFVVEYHCSSIWVIAPQHVITDTGFSTCGSPLFSPDTFCTHVDGLPVCGAYQESVQVYQGVPKLLWVLFYVFLQVELLPGYTVRGQVYVGQVCLWRQLKVQLQLVLHTRHLWQPGNRQHMRQRIAPDIHKISRVHILRVNRSQSPVIHLLGSCVCVCVCVCVCIDVAVKSKNQKKKSLKKKKFKEKTNPTRDKRRVCNQMEVGGSIELTVVIYLFIS